MAVIYTYAKTDKIDYAKNDTTKRSMALEMTMGARYTLAQ